MGFPGLMCTTLESMMSTLNIFFSFLEKKRENEGKARFNLNLTHFSAEGIYLLETLQSINNGNLMKYLANRGEL
jgi:hypothetical protein